MRRRHQRDDDDDDRILKDGEVVRVPMFAMDGMDSVQRSVCSAGAPVRDGQGGTSGLHRPGFRLAANDARKTVLRDPRGRLLETWETETEEEDEENGTSGAALRAAYREHEKYLQDAYKTGGSVPNQRAVATTPQVTRRDENLEECQACYGEGTAAADYEGDEDEAYENTQTHHEGMGRNRRRVDSRSVSQMMRHQQRMNDEYRRYDDWVCSQWKQR